MILLKYQWNITVVTQIRTEDTSEESAARTVQPENATLRQERNQSSEQALWKSILEMFNGK